MGDVTRQFAPRITMISLVMFPSARTSLSAGCAVLLVGALLSSAAARAQPATLLPKGLPGPIMPEGFGVNIHYLAPGPDVMARFDQGGYRFARYDFKWERV